jgi:hypothetical protein
MGAAFQEILQQKLPENSTYKIRRLRARCVVLGSATKVPNQQKETLINVTTVLRP